MKGEGIGVKKEQKIEQRTFCAKKIVTREGVTGSCE